MAPQRRADRFLLNTLLGEGGFCTVHLAYDTLLERNVAIKFLRADTRTPEHELLLQQEYLRHRPLKHPNILEVFDFIPDSREGPGIIMEYFPGQSLPTVTRSAGFLDSIDALVQVCRALNFLHVRGLVHGDLKTENLLVSPASLDSGSPHPLNESLRVKVLDLGLATRVIPGNLLPRRGTHSTIAPEVLRGMPADHRADFYSFGILILDSFTHTGFPPAARLHRDVPLNKVLPFVPPPLHRITRQLVQEDPTLRPATATDIIEALSDAAGIPFSIETDEGIHSALDSVGLIGKSDLLQDALNACISIATRPREEQSRNPSVFLIHGDMGVGKTLLIEHLLEVLKTRGVQPVIGNCPPQGASPFHPFQSLLDLGCRLSHSTSSNPSPPDPIALAAPLSAPALSFGFDRLEKLDNVANLVATSPSLQAGVLIIEDLHSTDEETYEVFRRLLGRAAMARFVLIATFRTEGLLAEKLLDLVNYSPATSGICSIQLTRFSLEDTHEYLRQCLGTFRDSTVLARGIHVLTEGNPLFLHELLTDLIEHHDISGGPYSWKISTATIASDTPPPTLRQLIDERLKTVPSASKELLEWTSAFEYPPDISLLHESSGLPYSELRRLLSSCITLGLLKRNTDGNTDKYSPSHRLYGQTLYESLSAQRRADLHRSIGVALEKLYGTDGPHLNRLAYHFTRACDQDRGPALAARAADTAKRRGATQQAICFYHDCLNLLPPDRIDDRYEILLTLADLLRQTSDLSRAETYYLEILLASRRRQDSRMEAIALSHLGKLHADRGSLADATAFATKALSIHEVSGNLAAQAEARYVLSMAAHKAGDYVQTLTLAQEAKRLADASHHRSVYGRGANMAGLALTSLRRFHDAAREFTLHLEIAEEEGDLIAHTIALANLGWVLLEQGDLQGADVLLEKSITRMRSLGVPIPATSAFINAGEAARLRGLFGSSRSRLEDALTTSKRAQRNELVQYSLYSLGLLDLECGALGESSSNLHRACELAERMGAKASIALTHCALGYLASVCAQYSDAEHHLGIAQEIAGKIGDSHLESACQSAIAECDSALSSWQCRVGVSIQTASTGIRLQNNDAVAPLLRDETLGGQDSACNPEGHAGRGLDVPVERSYALAVRANSPQTMVRADLAGALVYLASGDVATSLERSARAIQVCDQCGLRPDKARALLYRGMAHADAGRLEEAEMALEESRTLADEIGLAVVRARSRAELAGLADAKADHMKADQYSEEASKLLNDMAKTLPETDDRQRFLAVPWRQSVLDRREASVRSRVRPEANSSSNVEQTVLPLGGDEPRPDSPSGDTHSSDAPTGECLLVSSPDPSAPPDLRSTITLLLEESLRAIACDRGMVFLIAPDGSNEIVVARGLETESIQDARSYCRSVIDRAAQGEEILVVDTARDERFRDRHSVSLFHIVSIICIPLKVGPKVTGALYLDSRAGGRLLREDDFRAARAMAARMTGSIRAAWEEERQREEALLRQKALCQSYRLDAIIGESPVMKKTFRVLEAVIASDCNVLVIGESGTGKELAARAIHFSSRRKMSPFVPIDCGALPDTLVESELFGYRKGAFTGAEMDKRGLFEEADGGTLFLDEITNTSTLFQSKLLRVLQTGELRRVGDTVPRKVDVRILAATNADLEEAIRAGRFREDLFYRLNVVTVRMPPLRERPEDVSVMAEHFAKAYCEREKIDYRGIGQSALKSLLAHSWPGNVRELRNAIESALILSRDGAVRREYLPEPLRGGSFEEIRDLLQEPAGGTSPDQENGWLTEADLRKVAEMEERARILDALTRAAGDKSLAATILGCSRMTLYRKMQKLGIDYSAGRA